MDWGSERYFSIVWCKQSLTYLQNIGGIDQMMRYYAREGNILGSCPPTPDEHVLRQVQRLDQTNRKLLQVADAIQKTSFYQPMRPTATISEFEHEIRLTLNELISYIKEYYIDIDNKMKSLCSAIDSSYSTNPKVKFSPLIANPEQKEGALTILGQKVDSLQENLKKTQENERKLIQIIESICQKHQITEQPTLIRNDPYLKECFESRKDIPEPKKNLVNSPSNHSIHEKLNELLGRHAQQQEQQTQISQNGCYIKKIYSKTYEPCFSSHERGVRQPQGIFKVRAHCPTTRNAMVKKSLKFTNYTAGPVQRSLQKVKSSVNSSSEREQNAHRFDFLLRKLQEKDIGVKTQ